MILIHSIQYFGRTAHAGMCPYQRVAGLQNIFLAPIEDIY